MGLLVVHLEAGRECAAAQGTLTPAHPALGRPAPRLPRRLGARPKLGLRGDHLALFALRISGRGSSPLFVQLCALPRKRRGCRRACDRAGAAGPALHLANSRRSPAPPRVGLQCVQCTSVVEVGRALKTSSTACARGCGDAPVESGNRPARCVRGRLRPNTGQGTTRVSPTVCRLHRLLVGQRRSRRRERQRGCEYEWGAGRGEGHGRVPGGVGGARTSLLLLAPPPPHNV